MKFLPKPDSLIIIFFTLFLLTIFQYIFFFNVSSNTFKEIVIEEGTNIIGDKFLFSRKDEIVKSFGSLPELENEYKNSMIEKKENNRLIQKRAIEYIIFSGIVFGVMFIVCMILMIVGQSDLSIILPKLLISMFLVIIGFSSELYLYYLVIKPYKYISKYEILSLLIKKIKERIPNNSNEKVNVDLLINCIPKLLSNEACELPKDLKDKLSEKIKFI